MKRLILTTVGIALILNTPLSAQQAGENINVLPVVPQSVSNWEIKGDGYLQRQVEPTLAASTLNPDHLLAFFNDYRAVDVENDSYVGEEQFQVAALALNVAEFMMVGIIPEHGIPIPERPPVAAAEAWVGMSRSYDGGLTWAGGFLPGADFDGSDASLASPVYGLEAATDPVLAPAPCGYFYVVFMAFTRGGQSKLAVARYQDLNDDEGGDTITYLGTTVIETGNNADNGHFLDKPDIEVDVWRGSGGPEQCGHRVYVSYSTFVGLDKDGKFQSKVTFAKSEDFGLTYSTVKINKTWNQNQGSTIAVDPGVGQPDNKGGPGTIYVAWRHFFDPDAIIVRKSINYGASWATPVVVNDSPMDPFDQPTFSTDYGSGGLAFRSNAFPTATATDQGKVFVAWQERTDPDGSPRIVLARSDDDGKNWTPRQIVDNVILQKPYNAGVGGAWQDTFRGPQVMPKLSFSGGRLMLAYYESRGLISSVSDPDDLVDGVQDLVNFADLSGPSPGYITGYDRVVDFRAALLDPADGTLLGSSSSIQVSRYPISASADLMDGQQLEDVVHAAPCDPNQPLGPTNPPCARQVNRVNAPTSASGSSPFIGDYPDLVPMLQFVPDGTGGWKWATAPADVPSRGFHAIFTDNRNIIPPHSPSDDPEWMRYSKYSPPGLGADPCNNAGSRNSNVYTSRVDADLVISTPTTSKQLDVSQRSLPFSVSNRTDTARYYRFEIDPANVNDASFSLTDDYLECGEVKIFAYSSVSQVVYAKYDAQGPVKVHVTEINGPTGNLCEGNITYQGQTGVVTFSLDGYVDNIPSGEQDIQDPFVQNPFVQNPFVQNYGAENPFVQNASYTNYSVSNPFVRNPFVRNTALEDDAEVYGVVDTTWEVNPDNPYNTDALTNTASTYVPIINIDNADEYYGNYAFQLLVHRTSYSTGYRQAEDQYGNKLFDENDKPICEAYNIPHEQILSNVVQDPYHPTTENPFVQNPFVLNPFVRNETTANPFVQNPFVQNPFVQNSAFAMAPPEGPTTAKSGFNKVAAYPDDTTKADRASNSVKLTLRVFQLKPFCDVDYNDGDCIDRHGTDLEYDPNIDLPSAAVGSWPCLMKESPEGDPKAAGCFNASAADLVPLHSNGMDLLNPAVPDSSPRDTIGAGTYITFPLDDWDGTWVLKNQTDHPDAFAESENGDLTQGYYLCPKAYVDGYPKNLPLDVTPCKEPLFQDPRPEDNKMFPGQAIGITAAPSLKIPSDTEAGLYYLTVYVDNQVEISESNDVNNFAFFAVEITKPNQPPTFVVAPEGLAISVPEDAGPQSISPWAENLSDGDNDSQNLTGFEVTANSNPSLFTAEGQPTVDLSGTLTFTPELNVFGSSNLTVVLKDDGGALYGGSDTSAPLDFTITVESQNDTPEVTVTIDGGDPNITEGQSVSFTGTYSDVEDGDGYSSATWNFGDGNENSGGLTASHTYADNGNYSVTLTIVDEDLEDPQSGVGTFDVVVANVPPTANANGPYEALLFETISLDGTGSFDPGTGDTLTLAWDYNGDGQFDDAAGETPDYNAIAEGVFTIGLRVTDDDGDFDIATSTVTVIDPRPDWFFVGLLSPWQPGYSMRVGSVLPMKWYYTSTLGGPQIDSSMADPRIDVYLQRDCKDGRNQGDLIFSEEFSSGSDDWQGVSNWHYNLDTNRPAFTKGCYYDIKVTSLYTGQTDGPFSLRLK